MERPTYLDLRPRHELAALTEIDDPGRHFARHFQVEARRHRNDVAAELRKIKRMPEPAPSSRPRGP